MDTLGEKLTKAEQELTETSLYQEENKAKLNQVISDQAKAKSELEEVELEWMTAQETLEDMLKEFHYT